MGLGDFTLDGYSSEGFRNFSKLVGEKFGISNDSNFENYVNTQCGKIETALNAFKRSIPEEGDDRYCLQTTVHESDGSYSPQVCKMEPFMVSLKELIATFEEAFMAFLRPGSVSAFQNKKLSSLDRDHVVALLGDLSTKAIRFRDDICAHDKLGHLVKRMPQRFSDGSTDWTRGGFEIKGVKYKLPTNDSDFNNTNAKKCCFIDNQKKRYYLRDNNKQLCRFHSDGSHKYVVRQGSFGHSLQTIKSNYKKLFDF